MVQVVAVLAANLVFRTVVFGVPKVDRPAIDVADFAVSCAKFETAGQIFQRLTVLITLAVTIRNNKETELNTVRNIKYDLCFERCSARFLCCL